MTIAVSVSIAFAVAVVSTLVLTPWVMRLAARVGAMDTPNERKVHLTPTPRLGGVSVVLSLATACAVLFAMEPTLMGSTWIAGWEGGMLLVALICVVALGISDDIRSMGPLQKFLGQVVLALLVYFSGFGISIEKSVLGGTMFSLGILDLPLTVLWIVGVTNALNLIDGLDGLAAGVAMIAAMTMSPIAFLQGDIATAVLTLMLAGSLLGFLRYNFNPAKIFLGDSGSLFLGFILSILSLKSSTKITTGFALLMPILVLGLPIMDTLLSMVRRFLRSFLPENGDSWRLAKTLKSIFQPDRSHIHHRLISRGMSTRGAVIVLYLVSVALGVGAFAVTTVNNQTASLILLGVCGAVFVGVRQLRYREMAVLQNGVLLPLYDRPIMNRELLLSFFDLGFVLSSFAGASALVDGSHLPDASGHEFLRRIALAGVVQLGVFLIAGHRKRTYQFFGLGDVIRTVKTLVVAVLATAAALATISPGLRHEDLMILTYDLFFLSVLVIGMSLSYRVLHFLSRRQRMTGERVLLYGADSTGSLVLSRILSSDLPNWRPVGFMDDDPAMEGKILNGFPVLGGHWSLHRILREHRITEIILCGEQLQEEALRRVERIAKEYSIRLKRIRILYEDYRPEEIMPVVRPAVRTEADAVHLPGSTSGSRRLERWPKTMQINVNPSAPEK